jgi:two-component system, chemotaxis family, sensor kinase CheA
MPDDAFDLTELLGDFREEGRAQVAVLDAALVRLERGERLPAEARAALLRALHTLKGNAGMLGRAAVQHFVHALEEVLRPWDGAPEALDLSLMADAAAALRAAVARSGHEEEEEAYAALLRLRPRLAAHAPGAAAVPPAPPEPLPAGDDDEPALPDLRDDTLRVPAQRLDDLLNRAGELSFAVSAMAAWAAAHQARLPERAARRALADRVEELEAAADAVRSTVAELRIVPVGRLFARFPALARDIARAQGKRLRVVLEGEETGIDKSVLDALAEPLLHLVRNAVDHGIEPPRVREAAKKPAEGTLFLRAAPEGEMVRIEVEDDGAGLDVEAIVRRARERGILPPDAEPTEDEVAALVFEPGFSTRDRATELSGRGVGLDAARQAIVALRGRVEARPGAAGGTRFVARVPLTVAQLAALFFEAAGDTFAIPAVEVEETLPAPPPRRVGPAETVEVRDEALPLVRLGPAFGWEDGAPPRYVIVLRRGEQAVAVGAERLLAQRSATVRGLPSALGRPAAVSGATLDASGRVVLVLDAEGIMKLNVDLYRGGRGGG